MVREVAYSRHPIKEVDHLAQSFGKFSQSLNSFKGRIEEKSKQEAFVQVAEQVAHDLKSPLSALDMMLVPENMENVPDKRRNRILLCLERIKDITRMLSEAKESTKTNDLPTVQMLSGIVETILAEKRAQYRLNSAVLLSFEEAANTYGLFVQIPRNAIKRALSNLMDNAVQSISGEGKVEVRLTETDQTVTLSLRDTGKGIPKEILPQLGNRGATFGKTGGSGLGPLRPPFRWAGHQLWRQDF